MVIVSFSLNPPCLQYLIGNKKLTDDEVHQEYLLYKSEDGNDGGNLPMAPLQLPFIEQFLHRCNALSTKDLKGCHIP